MTSYNLKTKSTIDDNYSEGLLPQRNDKNLFYQDSSCRSNLSKFQLNSENRRILRKTQDFHYEKILLPDLSYTPTVQKTIKNWIAQLNWNFPISSVKNIFTNHIFNYVYIWKDSQNNPVAYSVCYFSDSLSHIAYIFYDPRYSHHDLPIRLVLQFIIDSTNQGLKYAYLGRFNTSNGYYKRNMPGFEFFVNGKWIEYNKDSQHLIVK
ncbi:MAG: hypothetical protein ACOX6N_04380 [Patescibacteria group bacterium]